MKVAVVADSTTYLPEHILQAHDIYNPAECYYRR